MNERVLYKLEYIEHVEKNVLVLWTPSYNELGVTIFWNIALVVNNALDVRFLTIVDVQIQRRSPNRRSDNNRVTGLHNSYPRVIAALNVLLELAYL